MLEAVFILSIYYAITLMPLRGKTLSQLNPKQQQRVEKQFLAYMRTRKGQQTPNLRMEEYLLTLQKQGLQYLIAAIVIPPIWLLFALFVYPQMLAY